MAPEPEAVAGPLNLKQVARTLGVHYRTAYRYVRLGDLPAHRVGAGWQVDRADLDAFRRRDDPAAGGRAPRAQRLARHLAGGDEVGAWAELRSALADGIDLEAVHVDVLLTARAQALAGAGTARRSVVAHLAVRLVARLGGAASRPGRARGLVVVVGPLGDDRDPHAAVAANLLRARGHRVLEVDHLASDALDELAPDGGATVCHVASLEDLRAVLDGAVAAPAR